MIRFFFPSLGSMIADSTDLPTAMNQIAQILRKSGIYNPPPVQIFQTVYTGILSKEIKIAG